MQEQFKGIFRAYSAMDVYGLEQLAQKLKAGVYQLDRSMLESVFSIYRGQTVFSIFNHSGNSMAQILDLLS